MSLAYGDILTWVTSIHLTTLSDKHETFQQRSKGFGEMGSPCLQLLLDKISTEKLYILEKNVYAAFY